MCTAALSLLIKEFHILIFKDIKKTRIFQYAFYNPLSVLFWKQCLMFLQIGLELLGNQELCSFLHFPWAGIEGVFPNSHFYGQ